MICVVAGNDDCEHIFSYEEGVDEAWINFEPKEAKYIEEVFRYCPRCGGKINYYSWTGELVDNDT